MDFSTCKLLIVSPFQTKIITMREKFRHDRPIMIKAYVGKNVTVEWNFVSEKGERYHENGR